MAPSNSLPTWGNEKTMNLNTLILTNIQSSPYFKVQLFELKTFHEVIDEIYYKVAHIEPWERGSRKTSGQTGMCGGVRGVGAGGIVSSAFCLLYKLYTLKLTRKQVNNLINHADSPYIRALGFMYIRFTQPPQDLWEWYSEYLDDEEEIDVKAGGGHTLTIGEMLRMWLVKLDWYSTLFPRIPVPVQKDLVQKLRDHPPARVSHRPAEDEFEQEVAPSAVAVDDDGWGEAGRSGRLGRGSPVGRVRDGYGEMTGDISREKHREPDSRDRDRHSRHRSRSRERERPHDRHGRSREHQKVSHSRDKHRSQSRERHRSRDHQSSRDKHRRSRSRERRSSASREERGSKGQSKHRRSRSQDRISKHKHRSHRDDRDSFERDLEREKKRHKRKGDY